MDFLTNLEPPLAAALVSGAIALLSLILNGVLAIVTKRRADKLDLRKQELEQQFQLLLTAAPDQMRVKAHLSRTKSLLSRVTISFGRLVKLAPTLDDDEAMLTETTNTLDLYAEYRQHLSSDEVVSYPGGLPATIRDIQKELSRLFLFLQVDKRSRQAAAFASDAAASIARLAMLQQTAESAIDHIIKVPLAFTKHSMTSGGTAQIADQTS